MSEQKPVWNEPKWSKPEGSPKGFFKVENPPVLMGPPVILRRATDEEILESRRKLANSLEDVFHDTVDNFPLPVGGITLQYSKASHAVAWLAVAKKAEEEFAPDDDDGPMTTIP